MRPLLVSLFLTFFILGSCFAQSEPELFWPHPPAAKRVAFVRPVYSARDIGIKKSFFKKIKGAIFGEDNDLLSKPVAIAVDSQKTFYICDSGAPAVYIFSPAKKYSRRITEIDREGLLSPVGIAVAENNLVFIADSELKKVFCVDAQGRFKFLVGEGRFLRPVGLAAYKNKLYVVDAVRMSVFIFDLAGNFITEFGKKGKGEGEFNYPISIAVDKFGNIYICDTLNFRVQVFNKENKFLYEIGKVGDSSGSFFRPKGIAVDSFGHIYITDGVFDNIQIFSQEKEFLLSLGEPGHNNGEFWIPAGVAIDSDNYIYAADSYNQRIQVFKYVGED